MNLTYTDEVIYNLDEIPCQVLDITTIDFSNSYIGRKRKETIVLKANGSEEIVTKTPNGLVESIYETKQGDAIFYNSENDIYVPRDSNNNAFRFDSITQYGYEITTNQYIYKGKIAIKVKSTNWAYVLPNVIKFPTCIKDAFGKNNHQFLFPGATLKKDIKSGKIRGINKKEFKESWEVLDLKGEFDEKENIFY